jgi:hypothetical protein
MTWLRRVAGGLWFSEVHYNRSAGVTYWLNP